MERFEFLIFKLEKIIIYFSGTFPVFPAGLKSVYKLYVSCSLANVTSSSARFLHSVTLNCWCSAMFMLGLDDVQGVTHPFYHLDRVCTQIFDTSVHRPSQSPVGIACDTTRVETWLDCCRSSKRPITQRCGVTL